MIYIKTPTVIKNAYYESMGIDSDVGHSHIYLNVSNLHIAPAFDKEGEIIEGACNLVNDVGEVKAHIGNKTPEQMLNYIGGQCIMEVG